jgi:aldose 1-epimerase
VPVHRFGTLPDATEIFAIPLANATSARCTILTYGATVQDLVVPVAGGGTRRVVLGFPTLEGYVADRNYIGVTAGRYASRLTGGRLRIDGRDYQLAVNDGGQHLHGGPTGFSMRPWRIVSTGTSSVLLALTSPDGDQGYPGTVEVHCLYRLEAPATLRVVMTATTDAPTAVSLAHHSYFSLLPGATSRAHLFQTPARLHVPLDADSLATGEIRAVAGTPLDFSTPRPIDAGAPRHDVVYALGAVEAAPRHAAAVVAPDRSLRLDVHTTEPCLIFYDGGHIAPGAPGHEGVAYGRFAGLCLEPIRFPDAPNQAHFPSAVLRPGEQYRQVTEYRFAPAQPGGP